MDIRRAAGWILAAIGAIGLVILALAFALVFTRHAPWYAIFASAAGYAASALIPLAILLVGLRLARPGAVAPPVAPLRASRVRPVPVVTEGDLAEVPEPIDACPRCGFLGIRMPQIGDGLWPGGGELGGRQVCSRCDWQGLPAHFDTRAEYAEFLRELQGAAASMN